MTENLSIKIISSITEDLTVSEINEKIKKLEKKVINLKLKIKLEPQHLDALKKFTDTYSKYQETRDTLEKTLNTVFPDLDSKRLTELLMVTPLSTGKIDLRFYDMVFDALNKSNYKTAYNDLPGTVFINSIQDEVTEEVCVSSPSAFQNVLTNLGLGIITTIFGVYYGIFASDSVDKQTHFDTEKRIIESIQLSEQNIISEIRESKKEQIIEHKKTQELLNKLIELEEKNLKTTNK